MTPGADPAGDTGRRRGRSHHRSPRLTYRIAGAAASLAVLGGVALALFPGQALHPALTVAADCGLVRCSAHLPATPAASPAAGAAAGAAGKRAAAARRASASPTAHRPRAHSAPAAPPTPGSSVPVPPSRHPSPSTTPAPPAGPPVTVTYRVDDSRSHRGGTRSVGHFTLVNHTGSRVRGWTLQARLPGDQVRWVSTSGDGQPSYPDWSQDRGGVIITGPQSSEAIPAHSSVVLYLSAYGGTTSPVTCTFNGASC